MLTPLAIASQDHILTFAILIENDAVPLYGLPIVTRAALETSARLRYLADTNVTCRERTERGLTELLNLYHGQTRISSPLGDAAPHDPLQRLDELAQRCDGWGLTFKRNVHGMVTCIGESPRPGSGELITSLFRETEYPHPEVIYPYLCGPVHGDAGGLIGFLRFEESEGGDGLFPAPNLTLDNVEWFAQIVLIAIRSSFDRIVTYLDLDRRAWESFTNHCADRFDELFDRPSPTRT